MTLKYLNPVKYTQRLRRWQAEREYSIKDIALQEKTKFQSLGFDYDKAEQTLIKALLEKQEVSADQESMRSIHWQLFAALAEQESIKNVLEIGTYDGETARIMTRLFPQAKIYTIDLPSDDPVFTKTYTRNEENRKQEFIKKRKSNLNHERIFYKEINSFFLPEAFKFKFDLIWIDGGHLYPEVAWDLCNAYHACQSGGWLMIDDILIDSNAIKNEYSGPDGFIAMEYMAERLGTTASYFLKRNKPKYSALSEERKYVGVLQKK